MSKNQGKKKHQFKGERTRSTLIIVAALIVFLAVIMLNFTPGYTLILSFVSGAATYELIKAVGAKSKALFFVSCAVSALSVCAVGFGITLEHMPILISLYVLLMLMMTVVLNQKIKYIETVMALFATIAVPYSFSCFIRLNTLKELEPSFTRWEEVFFVAMAFACSWLPDSFAFLVGRKIGKHKMTPNISPKKSVEGAVAGVLITSAINVLLLFIFETLAKHFGHNDFIAASGLKYLVAIVVSWILAVVGIFGDLAASVLKRNVGIKDYSNLLPGHGGIMDRFDSTIFVLPVLYAVSVFIFS